MLFRNKRHLPTVTFATSCWEGDWKFILGDSRYLKTYMIANHCYNFDSRILIVNNVNDYAQVFALVEKKVRDGVISNYFLARDFERQILSFFNLRRENFRANSGYEDDWVYFNATGVLAAIFLCQTDYLLYHTGDCFLDRKVSWIPSAITLMEKRRSYRVANLTWNYNYTEAERESYKKKRNFYISRSGFSDQQFLVRTEDFKKAIYNEIRDDSHHFPRGDLFEKRVFSFMKNHGWKRIIYRHGSYIHANIYSDPVWDKR